MSYGVISVFSYSLYYILTIAYLEDNRIFLFPNPFLFSVVIFSGIVLSSSMQEIDHHDIENFEILKLLVYALVPTYLAQYLLKNHIIFEESRKNDEVYILGLKIIRWIFLFLTFLFVTTIILSLFVAFNPNILILLIFGSFGLTGFIAGMELSKIRSNPPGYISFIQTNFLAPLIGSEMKRMIMVLFIISLHFTILLLHLIGRLSLIYI